MTLDIRPVTPDRTADLLVLFGANGAYSNCWCTWWILTGRDFDATPKEERRRIILDLVEAGMEPGLLAYQDGIPVGWCAVGPRSRFARLTSPRARTFRQIDNQPSWVVNCFYVAKDHRGGGIATALLGEAVAFAARRGASLLEGYPLEDGLSGSSSLFVGTVSMFRHAGFEEASRVERRPLMRLRLLNAGPRISGDA
jgi:GNAT superfamily N-acetyltransferase